ncbi:GAF domain-containing protein [Rheinheimera sp.]|jgi:GAF domain-containing protein|uniref:GAF domain-containing protein n=1 Tax=Rheinheimera sp. TaxID=1869214 RepID=UPI003D289398
MLDQTALLLLIKAFKDQQISAEAFYRQLTETITKQLHCSRASLWLYSDALLSEIIAVDLYDSNEDAHYQGIALHEDDFAPYFEAMRNDGGINAPDAATHPATSCFNEAYFEPNDILSLLDVGIRYNGQLVGVFCCEQVGSIMEWNASQITFLEQAGKLITFALKPQLQEKFAALF